jgi:putative PIN family toxin of toxin-antitoxin system
MIRVVLDTNIVVSSLLSSQGSPAQVFLMAVLDPDIQLCVSGDIFAEYEEVIRRPEASVFQHLYLARIFSLNCPAMRQQERNK